MSKKYIEYTPYNKEEYRQKKLLIAAYSILDIDQGYEHWKDELIDMYKELTGKEPIILDDRYWMVNEYQVYDLLKMYRERDDDRICLKQESLESRE